ncbi:NAD-dependent dehydratase [Formosa sediminum]|uniref:NAD-dependent dehydratase n=1 Tax=Formosa sediminum TaxID=2594004 RepID=A0A516GSY6_9FLAO|nr:NAD(P)H-binding protein [Formosa sediminum]QDO94618.1 NAD-dependent dehydratase [Formosa sediminum]
MKITLTSSLGNIGKILAKNLIKKDHEVTIISHSLERKKEIESINGKPQIGSLLDLDFLVSTFSGVDAVFLMNPPDYTQPDIREYYRQTSANFAKAIEKTGVYRVVLLSSFGGHLNYGTGPILGSHFSEEIIKQIPKISLTILRPTYFYYNLNNYIEMIKYTGQILANYGTTKFPLVSSKDIAEVATYELENNKSNLFRYIASSEHTGQEIATALGLKIGKPDLKWTIVSDEDIKKGMEQNGIPTNIASLFTEMYHSLENGRLTENYDNNKPAKMGSQSLLDFAGEFATLYNK